MKNDLNAALIFVEVLKEGSFSRAARSLHLPVSTVSDKVAALEASLGVTLLVRTTRKLKATSEGEALFAQVAGALQTVVSAFADTTRGSEEPSGVLRISAPGDFVPDTFAAAAAEYSRKFPGVKVETHFSNRVVDLISEGFDLAVRGGTLGDSSLRAKKLGHGRFILLASPRYAEKAPPLAHPRDLAAHRCLGFLPSEGNQGEFAWRLRGPGGKVFAPKLSFALSTTSFSMLFALARGGEGVALASAAMAKEDLARRRLVNLLPEWGTEHTAVSVVFPARRYSSPKVREMIPILEKHLRPQLKE